MVFVFVLSVFSLDFQWISSKNKKKENLLQIKKIHFISKKKLKYNNCKNREKLVFSLVKHNEKKTEQERKLGKNKLHIYTTREYLVLFFLLFIYSKLRT